MLGKLRGALDKPVFTFTNYHISSLLPVEKGMAFRRAGSWLQGAALEALHSGNLPTAWAEIRAATRQYQAWSHGHLLITAMIYDAGLRGLVHTTWDALQHPGWTETQLAEWQQMWQTLPCLPVVLLGIEGERAYLGAILQNMRTNPAEMEGLGIRINPFVLRGQDLEPLAEKPGETLLDIVHAAVWPLWTSYADERLSLERFQTELDGWRVRHQPVLRRWGCTAHSGGSSRTRHKPVVVGQRL